MARPSVLRADGPAPDDAIDRVATALRAGELAIIPTDTVYGLAAGNAEGLEKIYALKGRDPDKPIAILVDGVARLAEYGAVLDARTTALVARHWPGPLTVVVDVPGGTEGFRMPAHPVTLRLLTVLGGALRVTSANASGEPPARDVQAALDALGAGVALALDAGPLTAQEVSTVVRVHEGNLSILRAGEIAEDALLNDET